MATLLDQEGHGVGNRLVSVSSGGEEIARLTSPEGAAPLLVPLPPSAQEYRASWETVLEPRQQHQGRYPSTWHDPAAADASVATRQIPSAQRFIVTRTKSFLWPFVTFSPVVIFILPAFEVS